MRTLDYRNPEKTGAATMLELTLYFVGGFVSLMAAMVSIAFVLVEKDGIAKTMFSITAAASAIITSRSGQLAFHVLFSQNTAKSPTDSRLDD